MQALSIPQDKQGADDLRETMKWCAFLRKTGEEETSPPGSRSIPASSIPICSRGSKGDHIWPKARLRDSIDAIIAHEWEESKSTDHVAALKADHRDRRCGSRMGRGDSEGGYPLEETCQHFRRIFPASRVGT